MRKTPLNVYSLGEPINYDQVKRYEDSLAGQFELESSERRVFYIRVNELCYVAAQQLDPKKEPFYTGSCIYFYNHLSSCSFTSACWCTAYLGQKYITGKQGRRKRQKTGLQRAGKYHLRKMAEEYARLSSIDAGAQPRTITMGDQVICYPVSQTDNSIGLV
jgi:hypothetical protein